MSGFTASLHPLTASLFWSPSHLYFITAGLYLSQPLLHFLSPIQPLSPASLYYHYCLPYRLLSACLDISSKQRSEASCCCLILSCFKCSHNNKERWWWAWQDVRVCTQSCGMWITGGEGEEMLDVFYNYSVRRKFRLRYITTTNLVELTVCMFWLSKLILVNRYGYCTTGLLVHRGW